MSDTERNDSNKALRLAKDLLAGTVAGWAQVLTGQPFDTVKVRIQTQVQPVYSGPIDCVKKILANEGFSGFYKGTLVPMLGIGLCVSTQFAGQSFAKGFFVGQNNKEGSKRKELSYTQIALSGAFAGVVSSPFTAPLEHIRIRLQIQSGKTEGPMALIRNIVREYGYRKLFHGYAATSLREIPGFFFYFLGYEFTVKSLTPEGQTVNDLPMWKFFTAGCVGGYSMWVTCYPFDVIKTKIQTGSLHPSKHLSIAAVTKDIYKTAGIKGFYRGFVPCIVRALPVNAATFTSYELAMRAMGGRDY